MLYLPLWTYASGKVDPDNMSSFARFSLSDITRFVSRRLLRCNLYSYYRPIWIFYAVAQSSLVSSLSSEHPIRFLKINCPYHAEDLICPCRKIVYDILHCRVIPIDLRFRARAIIFRVIACFYFSAIWWVESKTLMDPACITYPLRNKGKQINRSSC